jgi:hypothetical protein
MFGGALAAAAALIGATLLKRTMQPPAQDEGQASPQHSEAGSEAPNA